MTDNRGALVFTDGARRVDYSITRTRRRTIGITIRPDASVIVRAPLHVSQRQIDDVLAKKIGWIDRKRALVRALEADRPCQVEFEDGESLPYLGEVLRLVAQESTGGKPRVEVVRGTIVAHLPAGTSGRERLRDAVITWYKEQARAIIPTRVDVYKATIGVQPARVVIKDQHTRWGSCSSKGNVNLNWRLILCPPRVMDYVVIHELCHLKIHSHSARFWHLVATLVPDYKAYKRWLDASCLLRDF